MEISIKKVTQNVIEVVVTTPSVVLKEVVTDHKGEVPSYIIQNMLDIAIGLSSYCEHSKVVFLKDTILAYLSEQERKELIDSLKS